jgi:hypothetical protein
MPMIRSTARELLLLMLDNKTNSYRLHSVFLEEQNASLSG